MRIDRLDLLAVGPFKGHTLDFSAGQQGLHLIYGHNEAGKSSALRAIGYWLFDFPVQMKHDDFRQDIGGYRVGGRLRDHQGVTLGFVRRKGSKNKTLDEQGAKPIDPKHVEAMLGGLDKETFESRYGLNHPRLVEGGAEIAENKGDSGSILFTAAGLDHLQKARDQLEETIRGLFSPSGNARNQTINANLRNWDEAQGRVCEARVPTQRQIERQELESKRDTSQMRQREREAQREWLRRVQRALPLLSVRTEREAAVAATAQWTLLESGFTERRSTLEIERATLGDQRELTQRKLDELNEQLAALSEDKPILEVDARVEALRPELGKYQKAQADRGHLVIKKAAIESEIEARRQELLHEIEQVDPQHLTSIQRKRITDLGLDYKAREAAVATAEGELAAEQNRIADIEQKLKQWEKLPACDTLERSVHAAVEAGRLTDQARVAHQRCHQAFQAVLVAVRQLHLQPPWLSEALATGDETSAEGWLHRLEALPLPPEARRSALAARLAELDQQHRHLTGQGEQLDQRMGQQQGELDVLAAQGDVPSRDELARVRSERDRVWEWVRRRLAGDDQLTPEDQNGLLSAFGSQDPVVAYPTAVAKADQLADRLWQQAEQVAHRENLRRNLTQSQDQRDDVDQRLAALAEERQAWQAEWHALWQPLEMVPDDSPAAMDEWVKRLGAAREKAEAWRIQVLEAQAAEAGIAAHRKALAEGLRSVGVEATDSEEYDSLLERAKSQLARLLAEAKQRDAQQSRLADCQSRRHDLTARRQRASADLEQWRGQWAEVMTAVGLDQRAQPGLASEVIGLMDTILKKQDEARGLDERIHGIDADAQVLTKQVQALCGELDCQPGDEPIEQRVRQLEERLRRARETRTQRQQLLKQQASEAEQCETTATSLRRIEAQLDDLCREAGVRRWEELPEAEQRSKQRKDAEAAYEQWRNNLAQHAGGEPLETFVAKAQAEDADTLPSRIAELDREIAELDQARQELSQDIGRLGSQLNAGDLAARAEAECQLLAAEIEEDTRRYVQARLAECVLAEAIERHRERNQSPVLKLASTMFAKLTGGSFQELRAEPSDTTVVLTGVRPDGTVVGVQGLSDGSRDQLYLALRLASLQASLDEHGRPPMPLILDDVFIQFDDARSAAGLEILGAMARDVQILFFTHHERLVELAREAVPSDQLFLHRLERDGG